MTNMNRQSDKRDIGTAPMLAGEHATSINERDDLGGQRRQVTVLFTDLVGYTPLARKLGEEETFLFMQRIIREMSEAVHAHGGTVQELTGDGMMAVFGIPMALEDGPLRACAAALDIQSRIAAIA
jgi:class 3 adenylate cyclase